MGHLLRRQICAEELQWLLQDYVLTELLKLAELSILKEAMRG